MRDHTELPSLYAPADGAIDYSTLADAYDDYTQHVSPDNMAISLRSVSYIVWLCEQVQARTVCDFGSGFTSYALRVYQEQAPRPVSVLSIDDDEDWLTKTKDYITSQGMIADGLRLWDEDVPLIQSDLVVYDFAGGDVRERWMGYALEHTKKVCVFDDANHDTHRMEMEKVSAELGFEFYGVEPWTRDRFNRYAAVAVR